MAHIAISEALDGKAVDWMEKVSDAQYGAPVRAQGPVTPAPGGIETNYCNPRVKEFSNMSGTMQKIYSID